MKGKLHINVKPLGYVSKGGKPSVKETLVHISRDKENLKNPNDKIDPIRTKNNINLYGDYKTLYGELDKLKYISSKDRANLNKKISNYNIRIKGFQKQLGELDVSDKKGIDKLQKNITNNQGKLDKLKQYRNNCIPGINKNDYYEVVMSISQTQKLFDLSHNKQIEYSNVFKKHIEKILENNPDMGQLVYGVAHTDQSKLHVHFVIRNYSGWGNLVNNNREDSLDNPYTNICSKFGNGFYDNYKNKLKDFGIELEKNRPYEEILNYTTMAKYKVRMGKYNKAKEEISNFKTFTLPANIHTLSNDDLRDALLKANGALKDRDNWIYNKVKDITYIDDKKHEIDILKTKQNLILQVMDEKQLSKLKENAPKDKGIDTLLQQKINNQNKHNDYMLNMSNIFQDFIKKSQDNLEKLAHIPDKNQRLDFLSKISKNMNNYLQDNKKNLNFNLADVLKFKVFSKKKKELEDLEHTIQK